MSDVDLPDDFFDDFTKNDFLEGLNVGGVGGSDKDEDDESNQDGIREKQDSVLKEIRRLERDIAARKKKIENFHSRSKSPSSKGRRRSTSRTRTRRRSRSRNRSRSRGRDRRHDRIRSRSRSGSRNIRSRSRQNSTGRSITFLEELAQKFAEQGKAFPEAEAYARHQNQPQNIMPPQGYPPMGMPTMGPGMIPPGIMYPNPMTMAPQGMDFNPQFGFPCPPVPIGYPSNLYTAQVPMSYKDEQTIAPPAPDVSMNLDEYANHSATDEIFKKTTKEQVITRCQDVIRTLRENKPGVLSKRFLYTRTVLSVIAKNNKFETPLKGPNNVDFKLTSRNFDETKIPVKKLSPLLAEIVTILGFPAERLSGTAAVGRMSIKNPPRGLASQNSGSVFDRLSGGRATRPAGEVDALPPNLSHSIQTQTDDDYCEKCIRLSLRTFRDDQTQTTRVENISVGCQASNEDSLQSLAELTPSQLLAINDFSKILQGNLIPKNYREATDLRDRLYNIYQTCTGLNRNLFPRDIDERMERDMRPDSSIGSRLRGNDDGMQRGGWREENSTLMDHNSRSQIPGVSGPYEPFIGVQDNRRGGGGNDPRRGSSNNNWVRGNDNFNQNRFGNDDDQQGGSGGRIGDFGFQNVPPNTMTSKQIMEMEFQRRNQQQNNFNRGDQRFGGPPFNNFNNNNSNNGFFN